MATPSGCARRTTVVVIGAGQAGLASSYCLAARGIDHVVLERGEVANSWRRERWDSLRLLTPNWQNCLPGHSVDHLHSGDYLGKAQVVDFLGTYAATNDMPVMTGTTVTGLSGHSGEYTVDTNRGRWLCHSVVVASGPYNKPVVPTLAAEIPTAITQLTPYQYRNPDQLGDGGVLVVGASATGMQIADELLCSGRRVTVAVGGHVRMPRTYRGLDIEYWMHATGLLDERWDEVDDLQRLRRLPSPQLVGRPDQRNLDLNSLTARGAEMVGRLVGLRGRRLQFSGSMANVTRMADLKQQRLLKLIDEWIAANDWHRELAPDQQPAATRLPGKASLELDLRAGEISTIIWATGFRPDYSWLKLPVLDRKGLIDHDGGVGSVPGFYAMGLPFMRRRKSASIFGAGDDARDICEHLEAHLHASYSSKLVSTTTGGFCRRQVVGEEEVMALQ